jgi:hypothetical protein
LTSAASRNKSIWHRNSSNKETKETKENKKKQKQDQKTGPMKQKDEMLANQII